MSYGTVEHVTANFTLLNRRTPGEIEANLGRLSFTTWLHFGSNKSTRLGRFSGCRTANHQTAVANPDLKRLAAVQALPGHHILIILFDYYLLLAAVRNGPFGSYLLPVSEAA